MEKRLEEIIKERAEAMYQMINGIKTGDQGLICLSSKSMEELDEEFDELIQDLDS